MFINEHEARVFNDQEAPRYRFKHCIIATGSRPIELKAFPFGGRIVSSTGALSTCRKSRKAWLLSAVDISALSLDKCTQIRY